LSQWGEDSAIGPSVVAAVYVDPGAERALAHLVKANWPEWPPAMLSSTARKVGMVVPYETVVLVPRKWNTLLNKMTSRDRLLNWAYRAALRVMLERYTDCTTVQFDHRSPCFAILEGEIPRGDRTALVYTGPNQLDAGLAAAGILARAVFRRTLSLMERELGKPLPLPPEDPSPFLAGLFEAQGSPVLLRYAKKDAPATASVLAKRVAR
jgi:ribonuclease HIII